MCMVLRRGGTRETREHISRSERCSLFSPGCRNASLYWVGKNDRTAFWTKEVLPQPRLPMTAISMSFEDCASIPKSSLRNEGRLAMVVWAEKERRRNEGG